MVSWGHLKHYMGSYGSRMIPKNRGKLGPIKKKFEEKEAFGYTKTNLLHYFS